MGTRPFTYADLETMPDDGYRREIIGGSLIVTPSPIYRHQRASVILAGILLAAEPPGAAVIAAPFDWKHPDGGLVQPDILVIRRADVDPATTLPASVTPLLVVEILSPSNPVYDTTMKRAVYEERGVPAYWIVDPARPALRELRLTDGRYDTLASLGPGEVFRTDRPFPVEIEIDALTR